ncbi:hypothetical protein SK128_013858, partial [Halocaridina rubra]
MFQIKYLTVDEISTGLADHTAFLEKVPEGVKLPVKEIGMEPRSHFLRGDIKQGL